MNNIGVIKMRNYLFLIFSANCEWIVHKMHVFFSNKRTFAFITCLLQVYAPQQLKLQN